MSAHPHGPGLPSSLRSGPRNRQDPESIQQQCSGRCPSLQPGHPQPPCGTGQSLPCSAAAPPRPASQRRELQPPRPCLSAVPRLPVEWPAPLAPQEWLSQRIRTGVCVSVFWSEPGSPAPAPGPRALSGVRGRLQPDGLGALEGQQIPAAHLEELERKASVRKGWELAARMYLTSLPTLWAPGWQGLLKLSGAKPSLGIPRCSINTC